MKKAITKQFAFLLILALSPVPLLAQQRRPRAKAMPTPLIRNINNAKIHDCGCYFHLASYGELSSKYIFFEEFSKDAPIMNIEGKDVKLKLISSTQSRGGKEKKGDRFRRIYRAGSVRISIDLIVTDVCGADEDCESTSYKATITATKGNRKQTIKVLGGCGC
jgi:hypothetical protein